MYVRPIPSGVTFSIQKSGILNSIEFGSLTAGDGTGQCARQIDTISLYTPCPDSTFSPRLHHEQGSKGRFDRLPWNSAANAKLGCKPRSTCSFRFAIVFKGDDNRGTIPGNWNSAPPTSGRLHPSVSSGIVSALVESKAMRDAGRVGLAGYFSGVARR